MAPPNGISTAQLPHLRTSLVGRERDIRRARETLLDGAAPLLTLTGTGGVGKTRLAVAVADSLAGEFTQGVSFVDLSPIHDVSRVMPEIAGALGIRLGDDQSATETVAAALGAQQRLLVLDNVEQVAGVAPELATLLSACPAVQILATSRVPLNIRVEHLQPVHPLALPEKLDTGIDVLAASDAVTLFVQRARAADPAFALTNDNAPAVAAICRRLDGLPLALELAAARIRSLSPRTLLDLLDDRLAVLDEGPGDLPDRQRSLRATIAWSYDLLDPGRQLDFRSLGVFPASFGASAAAAVLDTDLGAASRRLATLVDHNLLVREQARDGDDRFRMLESIREFAHDHLVASGEVDAAGRFLAQWCLDFVGEAARKMDGPSPAGWWDRVTDELPAIRASLDWALVTGEFAQGLRLTTAMRGYWLMGGDFRDGQVHHEQMLAEAANLAPEVEARAAIAAIDLPRRTGDIDRARMYCDRAVELARAASDSAVLCEALGGLPDLLAYGGRFADAWRLGDEAIASCRRASNPHRVGWVHHALALASVREGDTERALAQFDLARDCFEEAQHALGAPWVLTGSALALGYAGDLEASARRYCEALQLHVAYMSITGVGVCLGQLAWIAALRGQPAVAARLCAAVHALSLHAGWALTSLDFDLHDWARRDARARLGEHAFAYEWAAGAALSMEDAVELGLAVSARAGFHPSHAAPTAGASGPALSRREQEVMDLLCQHWTAPEIAGKLFLSPRTIESHITHIYDKLGVSNRREALAAVARQALAAPADP